MRLSNPKKSKKNIFPNHVSDGSLRPESGRGLTQTNNPDNISFQPMSAVDSK